MAKKQKEFKHNQDYCWGRKVAIYINRYKKWLKVGVYCNHCGASQIDEKFEKGIPKDK